MNALKFSFEFDAAQIKQEIDKINPSFQSINSKYIAYNELQGAHLIFPSEGTNTISNEYSTSYRFTDELEQCPYLQSILDTFKSDKFNYRIHNLKAKGKITLHRDKNQGLNRNIVRIHIPVTTTDQVFLFVDGERVVMQNGECWIFDVTKPHEVENKGDDDRLHLMIDCELNDWWRKVLSEHGVELEAPSKFNKHTTEELIAMKENLSNIPGFEDNPIMHEINNVLERRG